MKQFWLSILTCICSTQIVWAQQSDSTFMYEKTILQKAENMYADVMGNVYIITINNQIKKLNTKGDSIAVFNLSKQLSSPSYVDVTYPLKTLFFFKSYNTLITTDRLLHITNTIDLRKADLYQVTAIAASYDNQFWVYDEQLAKLLKIDNQGQIAQQNIDLRQQIKETVSLTQIIDNDNMVYLYDSAKGVYTFDYYGAFKNFTPFKGYASISIADKKFYGVYNNTLTVKNENAKSEKQFSLPIIADAKQILVVKNKIYYLKENEIVVYITTL